MTNMSNCELKTKLSSNEELFGETVESMESSKSLTLSLLSLTFYLVNRLVFTDESDYLKAKRKVWKNYEYNWHQRHKRYAKWTQLKPIFRKIQTSWIKTQDWLIIFTDNHLSMLSGIQNFGTLFTSKTLWMPVIT